VDYTSAKEKIIQFWRCKTLAVIKRHKNHLSLYFLLITYSFPKQLPNENNADIRSSKPQLSTNLQAIYALILL